MEGSTRSAAATEPEPADLAAISQLIDAGKYATALRETKRFGALESFRTTEARLTAGRLAYYLGAPRLAQRLTLLAYRHDPQHKYAQFYAVWETLMLRSPVDAWMRARRITGYEQELPERRVRYHCLLARIAALLRDFDRAQQQISAALAIDPDAAGPALEQTFLLERQDRFEEALELVCATLRRHPGSPSVVSVHTHLLETLDRRSEALEVLADVERDSESAMLSHQLSAVQYELGLFGDSLHSLERAERRSALVEPEVRRRFLATRSDITYRLGRVEEARELAEASESPFHRVVAKNLADASRGSRRVDLELRFIRQHHLTCAPATLSALSRHFGQTVDQVELADAICYDGTPAHAQREWARENGWVAREFTVERPIAHALLQSGIPFSIDTVDAVSAHMQAVSGYDEKRGTLLIRDPSFHGGGEMLTDELLESCKPYGPRGFLMLPAADAQRLQGLDLPDAEAWDELNELNRCLGKHQRDAAVRAVERLAGASDQPRFGPWARRILANYDRNTVALEASTRELLELYPHNPNLELTLLACMNDTSTSAERVAFLEGVCGRDAVDPVFEEQLALELLPDARQHERAARLLRRSLRSGRERGEPVAALASVHWAKQEFDLAVELYRLAAALEPTSDELARRYFLAARSQGRGNEALEFVEGRARRYRERSALPSITLFTALELVDRTAEAFDVLDAALDVRPADGQLLLFSAEARARYGQLERAGELVQRANGLASRSDWLRSAASVARARGDLNGALEYWRELIALQPSAEEAHQEVAQLLSELEGANSARRHLAEACQRFSHDRGLLKAHIVGLRGENPEEFQAALGRLLELSPEDGWAWRELALFQTAAGRLDEAEAALETARRVNPGLSINSEIEGDIRQRRGDPAAATAYREALERDADNGRALASWLAELRGLDERREGLREVARLVRERSVSGEGIMAWFSELRFVLPPGEQAELLGRLLEERPECWASHVCITQHQLAAGDVDAASSSARAGSSHFPLLPGLARVEAEVARERGDHAAESAALERALSINPSFEPCVLRLSSLRASNNQLEAALHVVDRALRHAPSTPVLLERRAELLWESHQREQAIATLESVLERAPGQTETWAVLADWYAALGDHRATLSLARRNTERRPWDALSWLALGVVNLEADCKPAALEALDRAIELNPRLTNAHDFRALTLTRMGRRDEALAACRPKALEHQRPVTLAGREAFVHAEFGDLEAAMRVMQRALEVHHDYLWGWHRLHEWCTNANDLQRRLDTAEELVRLAPLDAGAHELLAEAAQAHGSVQRAETSYLRALQLKPNHTPAITGLLDIYLGAGRSVAAQELVQKHAQFTPPGVAAWLGFRLAFGAQDLQSALGWLRQLVLVRPFHDQAVRDAANRVLQAAPHALADVFEPSIGSAEADPALGTIWAEWLTIVERWPSVLQLRRLFAENPALAERALDVLVHHCAETHSEFRLLSLALALWKQLRRRTALWAATGYALVRLGYAWFAIAWLSDYQRREGVQPWMLNNLVTSLCQKRRFEPARAATLAAVEMAPDHTSVTHLLRYALWASMRHDPQAAESALLRTEGSELSDFNARLLEFNRAILAVERADPAGRGEALDEASAALRAGMAGQLQVDTELSGWSAKLRLYLARQSRSPLRIAWAELRPRWFWLLVPLAVVVIVIDKELYAPTLIGLALLFFVYRFRRA